MANFEAERSQYEVVLDTPKPASCSYVAVERQAAKRFSDYLLDLEFEVRRVALLFGRWERATSPDGKGGVRNQLRCDMTMSWRLRGSAAVETIAPSWLWWGAQYFGVRGWPAAMPPPTSMPRRPWWPTRSTRRSARASRSARWRSCTG
jgi:hypothetical protein